MDEAQCDMGRGGGAWDLEFRQAAEARSAVIRVKGGCDLEPGAWSRRDINGEDS